MTSELPETVDANGYDTRPYDPRSALVAEQLGDLDQEAAMPRSARRPADALNPRPADAALTDALAGAPAPAMVPWRTQEAHTSRAYTYEAITSVLGRDVRVRVYRDGYEDQSYARAELLTPAGWQPLDRLLDPSIWQASYTGTTAALRRHAYADQLELLATAAQLIAHLPPSS